MSNTATATTRTAAEWEALAQGFEAQAQERFQSAADSFDRCDTDGFLSQWASTSTGQLLRAQAAWARRHGLVETTVLTDATTGRIVSTHRGDGQYGPFWVLDDTAADAYGRRFFNPSKASTYGKRAAANRKKGFVIATATVVGVVKLHGSGKGLSGAMSVRPVEFPDVDALKARQVTIVDTDRLVTLAAEYDDK